MHDVAEMRRVDSKMSRLGPINVRLDDMQSGIAYYLGEERLNPQIVRDMINNGWVIDDGATIRRV